MDAFVFVAVLFAAACHAGWNATIKGGLDPLATTVLISIGAAIVSLVFLPVTGLPAIAAWPWCAASVLIHLMYFAALIESYRAGDMGQVYPIARGSAPLMTAVATTTFIDERLGLLGLVRHPAACRWRLVAIAARRSRLGAARSQGRRFCAVHRGDDLRLFGGGWRGRTARRQRQRLFGDAVHRHRPDHADLRARQPRWRGVSRDGSPLGHRSCRRQSAARLLWDRDLGDDGGADCDRGGAAREQRAVRRGDLPSSSSRSHCAQAAWLRR